MPFVTYLNIKHAGSALTYSPIYTEDTNYEKWAMYEIQGAKSPRGFESLFDSVAIVLGNMKREFPTKVVVQLDKRLQVVESRPRPVTLVSFPIKQKDADFVASPFWFRDSHRTNILFHA